MSEWYDSQKKPSGNFRKFLQERIEKNHPRRKLTAEETIRLSKLQGIADKLKRGENVQNRQLQTWLSKEEYEQLEYDWKEQLELRSDLKDKPSDLKRYEEKLKQESSDELVFTIDGENQITQRTMLYHWHKMIELANLLQDLNHKQTLCILKFFLHPYKIS